MRLHKMFFLFFLGMCGCVFIMILQGLYIQAEGGSSEADLPGLRDSSHSGLIYNLKYYLFLPRTKLTLLVRSIRNKVRGPRFIEPHQISEGQSEGQLPQTSLADVLAVLTTSKQYVKYIVFVISNPAKREIRDLLRKDGYWAYDWKGVDGNPLDWKHYFVVGQNADAAVNEAVLKEAKENGDILIGSFEDSYKNLVYKTLWLIEWAADRYDFDTIVKCDDDTIINMSKYDVLMRKQDLTVPFYGGVRFSAMPVFRSGRYEVTESEWGPSKFPPYCSGGGYTLNKLAINALLETLFSGVQPMFLVEDAFMGTLAYHAQIDPVQLSGPVGAFRAFKPQLNCNQNSGVLLHYVKNELQRTYMEAFKKQGTFCNDNDVVEYKEAHPPKKKYP